MFQFLLAILAGLLVWQLARKFWLRTRHPRNHLTLVADPELQQAGVRLYHLQVKLRWLLNLCLSLICLPLSLWALRQEFQLWLEYFTWVALRYGLAFHPLATLGLLIPLATLMSTLLWQARNLFWGLSQQEQQRLQQQAQQIRKHGKRHPLWRWVWGAGISVSRGE